MYSPPFILSSRRNDRFLIKQYALTLLLLIGLIPASHSQFNMPSSDQDDYFDEPYDGHYYLIDSLTLAYADKRGRGKGSGFGAELFGVQFISRSGLTLQLVPLNYYVWKNEDDRRTTNYNPLWLRHYFGDWSHRAWPFVSVGATYFRNTLRTDDPRTGVAPAGEIGVSLGKSRRSRIAVSLKYLPAGPSFRDATYALSLALSAQKLDLTPFLPI